MTRLFPVLYILYCFQAVLSVSMYVLTGLIVLRQFSTAFHRFKKVFDSFQAFSLRNTTQHLET